MQPKSLFPLGREAKARREAKAHAKEEKRAKKAEAERRAQGALKRMMQLELSRGWQSWVVWWEEACYRRGMLMGTVVAMQNREIMKGWRQWREWYKERMRLAEVLARAARSRSEVSSAASELRRCDCASTATRLLLR